MYRGGEQTVSEAWRKPIAMSTTANPNINTTMDDDEHLCKLVLYKEILYSRVKIWDVVILIPNLLFLLFIVVRFNRARLKLRATSSPIFFAFYGLVICNVIISVIRCVVSMSVNAATDIGGVVDKVLWVSVRFFLLSTEMSVVIFGLAFGHLDSRSSIKRVLGATSLIALAFTITQGTLELVLPDDTFRIPSRDFYVYGHGGMRFWFCSSLVFTLIYLFILILPWTRLRDRLNLPTKKSFYIYIGTLTTLNLVQSIGTGLMNYTQSLAGLCVVDLTAAMYLTLYTPLVYHTFLSEFLGVSQPSIKFSYKAQVDDTIEEDTVSLPHQQSFSSLKTDSDYIYQVHTPSIYIPLYEPLTASPSTSNQRTFYSFASRKDPKSPDLNHYSSQGTVYTLPEMQNIRRRDIQKISPHLVNRFKFDANARATRYNTHDTTMLLSPRIINNFTSKSKYDQAHPFLETRRLSLGNPGPLELYGEFDKNKKDKITNVILKSQSEINLSSSNVPLELDLHNTINDNDNIDESNLNMPKYLHSPDQIDSTLADSKISDQKSEAGGLGDYLLSLKSFNQDSSASRPESALKNHQNENI